MPPFLFTLRNTLQFVIRCQTKTMRLTPLLAPVFAALAAADTTTVGYFGVNGWGNSVDMPGYTSTAASVAGINAIATTYQVDCMDDAPKTECHIKKPWTVIQGPQTYSITGAYIGWSTGKVNAVTATRDLGCTFTSYSESASCSYTYKATGTVNGLDYSTSVSDSTSNIPSGSISYYALPVTAGAPSFTAPAATKTPDAAAGPAKPLITACPLGAAAAVAVGAMF